MRWTRVTHPGPLEKNNSITQYAMGSGGPRVAHPAPNRKEQSITGYAISRHIGICADIRQLFHTCGHHRKRTTVSQTMRFQGIWAYVLIFASSSRVARHVEKNNSITQYAMDPGDPPGSIGK